jgi:hypothetical protein
MNTSPEIVLNAAKTLAWDELEPRQREIYLGCARIELADRASVADRGVRAVPGEPLCACKDRPASQCDEEWGPNCDMGNNAKHVRVSPTDPALIDAAIAAVPGEPVARPDGAGYFKRNAKGLWEQVNSADWVLPGVVPLFLAPKLITRPLAASVASPAAPASPSVAQPQAPQGEAVAVTVDAMDESVNGRSWWVVLRRGKHRLDDGKYGADFKNRAEWHAAGLRWILGQGEKPNIADEIYRDAPPSATAHAAPQATAASAQALGEAGEVRELHRALVIAEAALADIGDADREPGDDLAWCERRAAQDLPTIRAALATQQPAKEKKQ